MLDQRKRRLPVRRLAVLAALVTALLGATAVGTNTFGAGDRLEGLVKRVELALDPPPDRPIRRTVAVTPRPSATPTTTATARVTPLPEPSQPASPARIPQPSPSAPPTPTPTPKPTPQPVREAVDFRLGVDPDKVFAHELTKEWCAPAGVQMVLAIHGRADTSERFQRELAGRIEEWESLQDSRNGGWGPASIAEALAAYGVEGYEIRAYETRADALRDAAMAMKATGAPVILLTWRGAHTWIMNGYRADADPTIFPDAKVTGAYILDPWYPWVSSIWGRSDPPGAFQDAAEMERNYLRWKRPEGNYPDRDGKFIAVVPTIRLSAGR